jgi:predicted nucleic acid-binding protein
MASSGKSLSNMDMLIAAQAIASDAILVTRDGAFAHAEGLRPVANWAADI